jgi:2'-5' RNA ligase
VSDQVQRLFVAVPLPESLQPVVRRAQEALPAVPGLRLLHPDQLHVTLAFIGEVGAERAEAAERVVAELPAGLGGRGLLRRFLLLPSARRARVVTLAVDDKDGAFAALFEAVMGGLERAGVMTREKRPFRPHLTVARLRAPGPVVPKSECEEAPYPLESVCLYRSELKPEGACYAVLCRRILEAQV